MKKIEKSSKLKNVCYDIRGPVMAESQKMEKLGEKIIKLNIGNPALFGLKAPKIIVEEVKRHLTEAEGYCHSNGIEEAREAIQIYHRNKGIEVQSLNHIYVGNGVSELITMATRGLLNDGDEVLIPAPDYPLWTAAVNLSGGKPVHYICDESSSWYPDIKDMKRKINKKTKAIVIINPNNPTGALYPKEILESIVELAEKNQLIIFADEIYDQILYDENKHISIASLTDKVLSVTFNGLSKSHQLAGYRIGWMVLSGDVKNCTDYIEGLNILAGMRLCGNVPAQYAVSKALNNNDDLIKMLAPDGELTQRRNISYELINDIPGVSAVKPKAAFYLFPKIDISQYSIQNDQKMIYDLLVEEKILLVQGTGFNWPKPDHFRLIFLPRPDEIKTAIERFANFLFRRKKN